MTIAILNLLSMGAGGEASSGESPPRQLLASLRGPGQNWYIGSTSQIALDALRRVLPLSALMQAGGTATCQVEAHGLGVGDVVRVRGAKEAGYNGDHTVLAVPTDDTFTFAVASATSSPATASDPSQGIACASYVDDADVTGRLLDVDGDEIDGATEIEFDYQTGSRGLYVAVLEHTVSLEEGAEYTLEVVAETSAGEVLTKRVTLAAAYA